MIHMYFPTPWVFSSSLYAWIDYLSQLNPSSDKLDDQQIAELERAHVVARESFWGASDVFFTDHPLSLPEVAPTYSLIDDFIASTVYLHVAGRVLRHTNRKKYRERMRQQHKLAWRLHRLGFSPNQIRQLALRAQNNGPA